ncbi:hypothetical protein BIV24_13040 [Streptomyces colonosanans]|uniref:Uncharacterized protein n=1 Tax=Streptomyces colonosanans TaxID=1428652 RepID=A0A1S2PG96_9ACTN|nr:hypothetical protein BIV24_13040 [Streptomyces colonosanans]
MAAVLTVEDPAAITLEGVRAYAAGQLARYKLPRRLKLVPAVPRNTSGKLDKVSIRSLADGED